MPAKTKAFHSKSAQKSKPKSKAKSARAPRYVYYFGDGKADGAGGMKPLLGGKGANLAEMTRIGLPVPPGFTITTEVCTYFSENKRTYPRGLRGAGRGRARQGGEIGRQEVRRHKSVRCSFQSAPARATPCPA